MSFSWSHSALTSFETCPRRHYHLKVKKDIREPQGEELKWGNAVHKAAELRVKDGTPLPQGMEQFQPTVDKIIAAPGDTYGEQQIALDSSFKPCAWFDKRTWVRGIVDVMKLFKSTAFAGDYKTGKFKPDNDQLKLFAALILHRFPDVFRVKTAFLWLKDRKITCETYKRDELKWIWSGFLPRVKRFEAAFENEKWPPNPSGLCRKHCPVKTCEFNGERS